MKKDQGPELTQTSQLDQEVGKVSWDSSCKQYEGRAHWTACMVVSGSRTSFLDGFISESEMELE